MPELLLGLDVGSTSVRAHLVDLEGRTLATAGSRLHTHHPAPGHAEQDPEAVWAAARDALRETLARAGRRASDVGALGLATQRASVVVWERGTGRPVGPMVLWSDLRGVDRSEALTAAGFLAPPLAAVSKLEAALDAVPDGRARARAGELCWGTVDSYLVHRLTGGALHATDLSNAWPTCYLDLKDGRRWNHSVIEHQGLPIEMFPGLCESIGSLGRTDADVLGGSVAIGAILADQQSGMLAHDLWDEGAWKATYGTSAALMVCTGKSPRLVPGLIPLLQHAWKGEVTFACEGMVNSAGSVLDWLVDATPGWPSVTALLEDASRVDGADGVAILPALQGLGAPHHDPSARARVAGISSATSRGHLARAALEAVAFRIREIADAVVDAEAFGVPDALRVDGGLTASALFLQIQADLLARPVARHAVPEATGLGACIGAGLGCGLLERSDLEPLARTDRVFEPRLSADEALERLGSWRRAVLPGAAA
jgi:glycerol kinase